MILSTRLFKNISAKLVLSVLLFLELPVQAQELNCQVRVLSPTIQGSDKRVFETLQTAIFEFMNNRKWTSDQYLTQERIDCSLQITINKRISSDEFEATLQLQSSRPVYKTSYNSIVLNHLDESFNFKYQEFQTIEFNSSTFTSNLSSMLAFYAYVIIGMDYNTYALNNGAPYFQLAQTVVNNAQNAPDKGWRAFESTKNRYWITENIFNPVFKPLNECMYKYHRQGLDNLTEEKDESRRVITESLESLKKIHRDKPGSLLLTMFFNAKADEIVNIYSQAYPEEKAKIVSMMSEIDPTHGSKYQQITGGK